MIQPYEVEESDVEDKKNILTIYREEEFFFLLLPSHQLYSQSSSYSRRFPLDCFCSLFEGNRISFRFLGFDGFLFTRFLRSTLFEHRRMYRHWGGQRRREKNFFFYFVCQYFSTSYNSELGTHRLCDNRKIYLPSSHDSLVRPTRSILSFRLIDRSTNTWTNDARVLKHLVYSVGYSAKQDRTTSRSEKCWDAVLENGMPFTPALQKGTN